MSQSASGERKFRSKANASLHCSASIATSDSPPTRTLTRPTGVVLSRSGNKNDPGLLYFHLSPEECFFAAGFYQPEPDQLARLRGSAARGSKAFKAMAAKLKKAGLALSAEDSLKRAPRGFDAID